VTDYERKLNAIVDEIYSAFQGWTLEKIAKKSKLSIPTVWRIEHRVTKLPRFKTVYLLAKAAGYQLEMTLDKRLRLAQ
jgi:transcriptional regulator with XRE-family HTH domain